jgi:hypothetical protein
MKPMARYVNNFMDFYLFLDGEGTNKAGACLFISIQIIHNPTVLLLAAFLSENNYKNLFIV